MESNSTPESEILKENRLGCVHYRRKAKLVNRQRPKKKLFSGNTVEIPNLRRSTRSRASQPQNSITSSTPYRQASQNKEVELPSSDEKETPRKQSERISLSKAVPNRRGKDEPDSLNQIIRGELNSPKIVFTFPEKSGELETDRDMEETLSFYSSDFCNDTDNYLFNKYDSDSEFSSSLSSNFDFFAIHDDVLTDDVSQRADSHEYINEDDSFAIHDDVSTDDVSQNKPKGARKLTPVRRSARKGKTHSPLYEMGHILLSQRFGQQFVNENQSYSNNKPKKLDKTQEKSNCNGSASNKINKNVYSNSNTVHTSMTRQLVIRLEKMKIDNINGNHHEHSNIRTHLNSIRFSERLAKKRKKISNN